MKKKINESAAAVLAVLDVLLRHFAHGLTPGELARASGQSASNVTRYVDTLVETGFAERIPETGRIRPSHRLAQSAVQILHSLEQAKRKMDESIQRISITR